MTITEAGGRHAAPSVNGHMLAPFTIQTLGPVSALPRQRRWRHAVTSHRAWLAAVPVVLVNAVAFGAQLGFWHTHLPALAEAVLVALALESIAIYLAWQAHLALLARDSALRLRLSAYGMAAVIGAMNYSHYMAPGWRPTVAAVTFGMMSVLSPWLWNVHSRRVSRDALMAGEDLERHAVRLGVTRWCWHPVRSWRVMYRATWAGVTKPGDAIALLDGDVSPVTPADVTPPVTPARAKPRPAAAKTGLSVAAEAAAAGVTERTIKRRRAKARNAAAGVTP